MHKKTLPTLKARETQETPARQRPLHLRRRGQPALSPVPQAPRPAAGGQAETGLACRAPLATPRTKETQKTLAMWETQEMQVNPEWQRPLCAWRRPIPQAPRSAAGNQ
mmetsp:Transcript_73854/g.213960  ORF Transcript_73854/g.213960 Transcript_73854/m.213960 type:complete len:108 (-) Transcript_73854:146-469(-)